MVCNMLLSDNDKDDAVYALSQRPTYVEVGPLMTTRFGEVR